MAWVSYQRIVRGTGISGRYGESLRVPEKWLIRVDSPLTSKLDILNGVTATIGITWGSAHWELPALKAMEFDLSPESDEGMTWLLTVQFYVPPPGKVIKENGLPEDVWERSGGTTVVPAFLDSSGDAITNAAGDPLEGLTKEREEEGWALTKYFSNESDLNTAIASFTGRVNSAAWAGYGAKRWKCYFKTAKRATISKLDGNDDAGTIEFIESRWEFKLEPDTWKLMPWDVGFMEVVSGERKTITGADGKPVKQPVALNSDGTKKSGGQPPEVINDGAGADVYLIADWSTTFGNPTILPVT